MGLSQPTRADCVRVCRHSVCVVAAGCSQPGCATRRLLRIPESECAVNREDTSTPHSPGSTAHAPGEQRSDADALLDRRLRWRCRRGMLELDLLLLPYVEQHYWSVAAAEQALFLTLLEEDDPVLFEWFHGRNLPLGDAPLLHLIARIRGQI